jgi:hypothetical protein
MRVQTDAESTTPRRADEVLHVPAAAPGPRFRWRAVIHAGQKLDPARGLQPVAWHLADCDNPTQIESHCEIGQALIATDGNPDGHCYVGGVCPRCPREAPATPP